VNGFAPKLLQVYHDLRIHIRNQKERRGTMKKKLFQGLLLVIIAAGAYGSDWSVAYAGDPCYGPHCGTGKMPRYYTLHSFLHGGKPLPVFQAAPWYLYWPYDGYFLTPAPITGPFYAPPAFPSSGANPYFPAPVVQPPSVPPASDR
jgi:hypothetical protein